MTKFEIFKEIVERDICTDLTKAADMARTIKRWGIIHKHDMPNIVWWVLKRFGDTFDMDTKLKMANEIWTGLEIEDDIPSLNYDRTVTSDFIVQNLTYTGVDGWSDLTYTGVDDWLSSSNTVDATKQPHTVTEDEILKDINGIDSDNPNVQRVARKLIKPLSKNMKEQCHIK